MFSRRPQALGARELAAAGVASGCTLVLAYAATHKLGLEGLVVPLGLVLVAILVSRPLASLVFLVGLVVLCEGPSFGILNFTSNLYGTLYRNLTVVDGLVALALFSITLDAVRHRRPMQVPRPLALPLAILMLAMLAGVVTGHEAGASLRFAVLAEDTLAYLLLLPLAIANLNIDRGQMALLLKGAMAVAILKAALGLIEVAGGYGSPIEGSATLTYYEPTANWLITMAILGLFAALVARVRPPLWMLLGSPLLIASLVFSYRRSFWIGAVLGLLLVLLLGTSSAGRRLLVPASLCVAVAIWLLSSVNFQDQIPLAKRAASLSPTSLQTNLEDRYRLDERADVLAEIGRHPINGIGVTTPWTATARTPSVEHPGGRLYVHFTALWYWLKLGILGLVAYLAVMAGSMILAWQAWRRSREPIFRAFGLASLCGFVGLMVMETTASFTGTEARFTVLFAAQLGLLALIARTGGGEEKSLLVTGGSEEGSLLVAGE